MSFVRDKAFECENGIILFEGGAGIFSNLSSSPIGADAPVGSKFLGTDGSFWTKFDVGSNDWKSEGKGKTISSSLFNGNSQSYLSKAGATYEGFADVLWPGSDNFGSISSIMILARVKASSKAAAIRIFDVTNSKVIVEIASYNNSSFEVLDMGNLINQPSANSAYWEIQGKRINTGGEAWLSAFLIEN